MDYSVEKESELKESGIMIPQSGTDEMPLISSNNSKPI